MDELRRYIDYLLSRDLDYSKNEEILTQLSTMINDLNIIGFLQ